MQIKLSPQLFADEPTKKEGVLISITSFLKENPIPGENKSIYNTEIGMPWFYTEPIFKAKEHDTL